MYPVLTHLPRLLGAATIILVLAACGSDGASNGPSGGPPAGGASGGGGAPHGVVATDFAFALESGDLGAGPTTFNLKNDGDAPHNFAIQGEGIEQSTPIIQGGQSASITVDLKPGTYAYLCTVPGHAQLGMEGSFTVK
jgi:plastocyanin